MYKILVDDRESQVVPFFKKLVFPSDLNVQVEVKRIQIGDYCICYNDVVLFVIERKTFDDLAASIKDGRKENVNKLLALRDETQCKIIYLIEGKARHAANKKIGRIPFKNLQSHLDHLMFRDNIFTVFSSGLEDTTIRIKELLLSYITWGGCNRLNNAITNSNQENKESKITASLTTIIPKTDLQIIYNIWCCIPNITTKTASIFIEKDINITDFLLGRKGINEPFVSTSKYTNGSIIGQRAKKIIKIQKLEEPSNFNTYYKMLACIVGITKATAKMILDNLGENGFRNLLENKIPQSQISNIKKTEKIKVGNKAAANIFKFFVYLDILEEDEKK